MVVRREVARATTARPCSIPLPAGQGTGLGKPLKLINHPVRADDPDLVGVAHGQERGGRRPRWPTAGCRSCSSPSRRRTVWGDDLDAGLAKRVARPRRRSRSSPAACVAIGEDLVGDAAKRPRHGPAARRALRRRHGRPGQELLQRRRPPLRLRRRGRSRSRTSTSTARRTRPRPRCRPSGWRRRRSSGRRSYIAERVAAYKEAGVTVLNVNPVGADPVKTIEQLREIVDGITDVANPPSAAPWRRGSRPSATRSSATSPRVTAMSAPASPCTSTASKVVDLWGGVADAGERSALRPSARCSSCSRRRKARRPSASACSRSGAQIDYDAQGGRLLARVRGRRQGEHPGRRADVAPRRPPGRSTRTLTLDEGSHGTRSSRRSPRRRRSGSPARSTATTPSRTAISSASSCARQRQERSARSSPTRSPTPLGLDFWIGLPASEESRVAPLVAVTAAAARDGRR